MVVNAIHYFVRGLVLTLVQLLLLLGPALFLAYLMQHLSNVIRNQAARLFGHKVYIGLTALGVIVHELGHTLFCILFRHRITDMQLFKVGHDGTLGHVNHAYNPKSRYQSIGNFFIGTGPIWLGAVVMYVLALIMLSPTVLEPVKGVNLSWSRFTSRPDTTMVLKELLMANWHVFKNLFTIASLFDWKLYLFTYFVFCIGSHVTLSRSDMKGAAQGFYALSTTLLIFNWLTLWLGDVSLMICEFIAQYYGIFYAVMLFALTLNGIVFMFVYLGSMAARR